MPNLELRPERHTSLALAFWGAGVGGSALLALPIALGFTRWSTPVLAVLLGVFVLYSAWALRLIWCSAGRARNRLLGAVARALAVAWTLNVALLSAFLLLSRLGPG